MKMHLSQSTGIGASCGQHGISASSDMDIAVSPRLSSVTGMTMSCLVTGASDGADATASRDAGVRATAAPRMAAKIRRMVSLLVTPTPSHGSAAELSHTPQSSISLSAV